MIILGINESHNATACILRNGKIEACVQEERFTKKKNQGGFPHKAFKFCLQFAKISSKEIDLVVFSYRDVLDPVFYSIKEKNSAIVDKIGLVKKVFYQLPFTYSFDRFFRVISSPIIRYFHRQKRAKMLGISPNKILYMDHHTAHAWAASFTVGDNAKRQLIVSNDASGDRFSGKIFVAKNDIFKQIASTKDTYSLGYLYYYVTQFLGFKPNEEEYKVMGLAPYADKIKIKKMVGVLKNLIWNQDLGFKSKVPSPIYLNYFEKKLQRERFDVIAGGIQQFTEELLIEQVKRVVSKTKITNIVLTGGLAMNVKANLKIANLTEVKKLVICPSSGDESTAIGCCYWGYKTWCKKNNTTFKPKKVENLYVGPAFNEKIKLNRRYLLTNLPKNLIAKKIAQLLSEGKIVARFSGRMEFGQRALGNRSILADPRNVNVVKEINAKIKGRDFWMPFAPVILKKDERKYIKNHKNLESPYMMLAFNSTQKAKKEIPAALHQADFTCRPQILSKNANPEYYQIIEEFKKLTGVSALLNTSFNLHGEPIVCSPQDALGTFKRSNLNYLILENYLIQKK